MRSRSIVIIVVAAVIVLIAGALVVRQTAFSPGGGSDALPTLPATPRPTAGAPATPKPTATAADGAADLSAFTDYVALGDSYAAGVGAGPLLGPCQRTGAGYPSLLAADGATLDADVSCGGATTADVRSLQIGALSDATDLVTLTIGGNDLNAIGLATECAQAADSACQKQFADSLNLLKKMPTRLLATFADVATAAPNARIIVTGYPNLFELPAATDPEFSTIAIIDAATDSLDNMIQKAVARVRASGADITYVPISFHGHGIGSRDPWINGADAVGAFHPTPAGYAAYEQAITDALAG